MSIGLPSKKTEAGNSSPVERGSAVFSL